MSTTVTPGWLDIADRQLIRGPRLFKLPELNRTGFVGGLIQKEDGRGERERLKELERENRELKRANDILRKASAFFAQAELDRRWK